MHDIFSEKFAAVCGDEGAPAKLWCFTATHNLERLRVLRCGLSSMCELMELKPVKSRPSTQQHRPQGLSARQALAMLENDQGGNGDSENDDILSVDEWVKALSEQLLYDSGDDDDMNARELADADRKATGEDIIQSHADRLITASVQSKRKRQKRSKASTDTCETSDSDEQPNGIDVDVDDVPAHMLETGLQGLSGLSPAEMAHEAMLNVAELGEEPELAEAYAALKQTALKPRLEAEHLDAAVQCWASEVEASASAVKLRFANGGPDMIGKSAELSLVPWLDFWDNARMHARAFVVQCLMRDYYYYAQASIMF